MLKKVKYLKYLILIVLLTSIFMPRLIMADSMGNGKVVVTRFNQSQGTAEKAAIMFLVSDIYSNPDSGWNEHSKINKITALYDIENNVTAFEMEIINNSEPNGYIIVSNSEDLFPIIEFSYASKSPIENIIEIALKSDKDLKVSIPVEITPPVRSLETDVLV